MAVDAGREHVLPQRQEGRLLLLPLQVLHQVHQQLGHHCAVAAVQRDLLEVVHAGRLAEQLGQDEGEGLVVGVHLVGREDDPEVFDECDHLGGAELEEVLLEGVEDEVDAGVELVEVAAVAVGAQRLVLPLLRQQLRLRDVPEQPQVLDDVEVGTLHLLHDLALHQTHLRLLLHRLREPLQLRPQRVEALEGVGQFAVDPVGVARHHLDPALHVDQFGDAGGADGGVLLGVGADDAGDVVAAGLGELEGDADGGGGEGEGGNGVVGRELAEVLPHAVLVGVDGDGLVADLLLAEGHLQVADLVLPLQDPLHAVQVRPQLVLYAVQRSALELHLRLAEALQAPVGLQQVRLELPAEVDHVRAQTVQPVLLSAHCLGEDLLGLGEHGCEERCLLRVVALVGEVLEDVGDEGEELLAGLAHGVEQLHARSEERDDVEPLGLSACVGRDEPLRKREASSFSVDLRTFSCG